MVAILFEGRCPERPSSVPEPADRAFFRDSGPGAAASCDRPAASRDDGLAAALDPLGIDLAPVEVSALERYARAVWDWNERLNLTRHTSWRKFAARDVVDALRLASHLAPGERLLDVGSGGGVPGAIVAVVRPDLQVTLCESVAKKARALSAIAATAELPVRVVHARAEDLLRSAAAESASSQPSPVRGRPRAAPSNPGLAFESLVVRAVAPLPKLLGWFRPCWPRFGRLLCIKGPAWVDERHAAREAGLMNGLKLRRLATWPLPDGDSESVLLEIERKE